MEKIKKTKTVVEGQNLGLFNEDTGEYKQVSGDYSKITIEEWVLTDVDERKELVSFNEDVEFVKHFRGNGVLFNNSNLKDSEIATFYFIQDFVCYSDCILREGGSKKGSPLTIEDIAKLKGVPKDTLRKIFKALKDEELIDYHNKNDPNNIFGYKAISVNPFVMMRGVSLERWVIIHYANTKWAKQPRRRTNENKRRKKYVDEISEF